MASNILSASKHTPLAKKVSHLHYYFTLRYNNIEKKEEPFKKCDIQGSHPGDTWKEAYYIYFQGKNHCIFINKMSGIKKRESELKTDHLAAFMPFKYFFPGVAIDQIDSFKDKLFKRDDILRILDPSVITKNECRYIVSDIKGNP